LSFLGLGIQPPTAEWGIMIADGKNFIAQAWWISFFPGLAIIILAVGFSLLADGFAELLGAKD
jgi:peptide/nickel transport system permease protein